MFPAENETARTYLSGKFKPQAKKSCPIEQDKRQTFSFGFPSQLAVNVEPLWN